MSRCLVTGCGGFIGSYLAAYLRSEGIEVYGLVRRPPADVCFAGVRFIEGDVLDRECVAAAFAQSRPQWVVHLAAQDDIIVSWSSPEETFRVNTLGTLNLLETLREQNEAAGPRVVIVGSSAEYGLTHPHEMPIREVQELRPTTPYGVSKVAQDLLARAYALRYGLPIVRVRPFHVTGPGKLDSCGDFARRLAVLERAGGGTLFVGNLDAVRDIVDVRDAVRALWVLARGGTDGEVYNLSTGVGRTMGEVVETLVGLCRIPVGIAQDPARVRPADDTALVGNAAKLAALGWSARIPWEQTMRDILQHWRTVSDQAFVGSCAESPE